MRAVNVDDPASSGSRGNRFSTGACVIHSVAVLQVGSAGEPGSFLGDLAGELAKSLPAKEPAKSLPSSYEEGRQSYEEVFEYNEYMPIRAWYGEVVKGWIEGCKWLEQVYGKEAFLMATISARMVYVLGPSPRDFVATMMREDLSLSDVYFACCEASKREPNEPGLWEKYVGGRQFPIRPNELAAIFIHAEPGSPFRLETCNLDVLSKRMAQIQRKNAELRQLVEGNPNTAVFLGLFRVPLGGGCVSSGIKWLCDFISNRVVCASN